MRILGRLTRLAAILAGCGLAAASVQGQPASPTAPAVSSRSGQFIVQAASSAAPDPILATNRTLIHLEPTLLAISAERIKQGLWQELGVAQRWQSRIFVTLYSAARASDPGMITSDHFQDGWQYHLLLPDLLERGRYVRAITQVLLLELANRSPGPCSPDLPIWLLEGLGRQLLASKELEIILPPPTARVNGIALASTVTEGRWQNPLDRAHKKLTSYTPLTFQDLSWPTEAQLNDEAGELYRSSAQLFVTSLLRLDDGRACMQAFLAQLPQNYNWQFAFLRAFGRHFAGPLEVEKWWALQLADFTGSNLSATWSAQKSWSKLDEAIRSGIEIRSATNEMPFHAQATLQDIVRDWERGAQTFALQSKLQELGGVESRVSHELVPVVADYRKVLASYLAHRDRPGLLLGLRKNAIRRRATAVALMQLDALDAQRMTLRPVPKPFNPAQAQVPGPGTP